MAKILYVESDRNLAQDIRDWLKLNNFMVDLATCADSATTLLKVNDYDLILLERDLCDADGIEVCRSYRSREGRAPILILTARGSIDERIEGLDAGADDYLCKPFHLQELLARVRTLLRRQARPTHVLRVGELELDPLAHRVTKNGEELKLSPREFALLEFFMRNTNQVFSSDTLLRRVWSGYSDSAQDTVRVTINRLRSKMNQKDEDSRVKVKSIYGVGYRLSVEADLAQSG